MSFIYKDLIKSKERVVDFGEVFTPNWVVEKMLDLLPDRGINDVWKVTESQNQILFLEPACGEGAFLIEILTRKLAKIDRDCDSNCINTKIWKSIIALSSIYGIELLEDNVHTCKEKLLQMYYKYLLEFSNDYKFNDQIVVIATYLINKNIINGDALTGLNHNGSAIVISEWQPKIINNNDRCLLRKDFIYKQIMDPIGGTETLFGEPGLIREFDPIPWLQINKYD